MIPVTFNSATCYLIDDQPDWMSAVQVDAAIPAAYERSLTGKETRRQTGDTLRLELKWTALVVGDVALTNLRNSLQVLNTQSVLCPFWPGRFEPGTQPTCTAANYVLLDDSGSAPSLQPASALGAGFARTAYPLLVGILPEIPDPDLQNDAVASVDFHFAENDVYVLTPPAFTPPAGISAASGVRPLFPYGAEWSSTPHSGAAEVDIKRDQIGEYRQLASVYYNQRGRRRLQQAFTLTNTEPFNLLSFFVSMGGEQSAFWLPGSLSEAVLVDNVLSTDTTLTVDNGATLSGNTFIMLDDGTNRVPLVVASVSGNVWTLTGAVGTAFGANVTRIETLVLARFDALKLSLKFVTPTVCQVQVKYKELPWETAAVAGETIGTTMGSLPTTAMLYVFTLTTPGGSTVYYFTNFERNLTDAGSNVYLTAPIENEDIIETPTLERQSVAIKTRNFAGNPLALLVPFQLEWPLEVAIYEADVTGNAAGNLRCYFAGEVADASLDGPVITANCTTLSWIFDRTAARRLYQNSDNWVLFETANGLAALDWKWTGVVVSYNAATATLVIGTIASSNGATLVASYFAAGYIAVTHAGATQYRMISDNTAPAAGQITLYISQAFTTAPVAGDTIAMYAGYDGQATTAINKFNNYANFGGFPFIPVGNPFVLKIQSNYGGGKK